MACDQLGTFVHSVVIHIGVGANSSDLHSVQWFATYSHAAVSVTREGISGLQMVAECYWQSWNGLEKVVHVTVFVRFDRVVRPLCFIKSGQ